MHQHLPPALQGLYSPSNINLSYTELLASVPQICTETATESQIKHIEGLTRGQASNTQWFKYRAGRITASQIYQVDSVLLCINANYVILIRYAYRSPPIIIIAGTKNMLS